MNYVLDAWYVAAWSDKLKPREPMSVTILGQPIVMWRTDDGAVHALEDRCIHRLAPLSLGRCEGDGLRCMYHGMRFAADGRLVEIPGQEAIPTGAGVRAYPAIDRHGWIWLWMGNKISANDTLIPPVVGADNADWVLGRGDMEVAAEARLLNDNLLDFSHVAFLHGTSFRSNSQWQESAPDVTALPRGVRVNRWIAGVEGATGPADLWISYDFLVPGILVMKTRRYELGAAARGRLNPAVDDQPALSTLAINQAITPTEEGRSRYFFSEGPPIGNDAEEIRDRRLALLRQALSEDKRMIEGQQRVIARTREPRVLPTKWDKAIVLYNRLVAHLCDVQTAESPPLSALNT